MRFSSWILAAATAASLPGVARAQEATSPFAVEISALGVWHSKTTTMGLIRGYGVGGRLGLWLPANFQIEGQLDFTAPQGSTARAQLFHYAGSALYNIPMPVGSVYLRAGYGWLSPRNCQLSRAPCPSHSALTGALGVRVALRPWVQVRAEGMVRNRSAYDYSAVGGALGISLIRRFGSGEAANTGPDTDRDGVADRRDRCPNTPLGALPDARGCPTDRDRDGVPDGIDRCPTTPAGVRVDKVGCPASPAGVAPSRPAPAPAPAPPPPTPPPAG